MISFTSRQHKSRHVLKNNHTDTKDIYSIIIKNININEYEKSEKHKKTIFFWKNPQKKLEKIKHIDDNISSFFDKNKERNKKEKNKNIYNNSSRSIKYKIIN